MKSRFQKKQRKLLAENKLLKGELGRELRREMAGKAYLTQADLEGLRLDVAAYWKETKWAINKTADNTIRLLAHKNEIEKIREDIRQLRRDLSVIFGLAALMALCVITAVLI